MIGSGLDQLTVGVIAEAQQAALLRIHLALIGATHQGLLTLGEALRSILARNASADGTLDTVGYVSAQQAMRREAENFFSKWVATFQAFRWQAVTLPIGMLAVQHEWARGISESANGQMSESTIQRFSEWVNRQLLEAEDDATGDADPDFDAVFRPQLGAVIDAANQRIYKDGIPLSGRIWNLQEQSLNGINQVLAQGVAEGNSAWNIAKLLQEYLGAGADCPRWTSTRLYKLTKQDIASGDRTGLYSREACAGQGVAYNALRLARNEIQVAHHLSIDSIFAKLPWVEKEVINLSPSHPDIGCACEDVVVNGEDGTNVYPKGEISLPIHVQCLCYKTAVLMDDALFVEKLRGWANGSQPWQALDDYAGWLGVLPQNVFAFSLATTIANNLLVWLYGDEEDMAGALGDTTMQLPLPTMD
ncbi:MAG: hypothetical protein JXR84_15660 [Anaerolineae bacterium]|nr:hypothetical protein [Anaerolineae bacterium]